ncbi:3-dehydrosphinganine reductase TSC10B [Raphanus sativus]|nr:3-dehydrosphinganine reductase TSC10B [Raphanus sativus]
MEEVKFMIDVNLVGSFNVIKAALPLMKGRGGPASISLVSSQAGQRKRPELTSIIAASSGSMKTKEVAKICMDGIKAGKFTVTCHFVGYLLSIVTSGMSPQRSFWHAFNKVMFGGLVRFVGLFFQWTWYNTIEKWSNSKTKHPISS